MVCSLTGMITTRHDRALLLRLAREAIEAYVGAAPAHVTGRRRGSLGTPVARSSRCTNTASCAAASATSSRTSRSARWSRAAPSPPAATDPRFPPITADELPADRHRDLAARAARADWRPRRHRGRPARPRRAAGMAARAAAAAGGDRVGLGRRDVPRADVPQGRRCRATRGGTARRSGGSRPKCSARTRVGRV